MADSHSKSVPCRTLRAIAERHSRHTEDTPIPFDLPAVHRKKITVDFNGGNQSSNAGLLLLREAERKRGVCQRLAAAIPDHRDPDRGRDHRPPDLVRPGLGLAQTVCRIAIVTVRYRCYSPVW